VGELRGFELKKLVPHPAATGIVALLWLGAGAALVASETVHRSAFVCLALVLLPVTRGFLRRRRRRTVVVEAGETGLLVDGHAVARASLTAGMTVPADADGSVTVRLRRSWLRRPIELVAADEAEGRALLRTLGLDVTQAALRFRGLSRAQGPARGCLIAVALAAAWLVLAVVTAAMFGA
jgi:hypothetical protein